MLKKIKTKTGKEVQFRYLCKEDVKDLLALYNNSVDEKVYTTAISKVTIKEERNFIKNCLNEIEEGEAIYLVAEFEKKVLGIASIVKKNLKLESHKGDYGILIAKELQGEGVGEEISKLIISEAKKFLKLKIIILRVFEENLPAINLYKKLGFEMVGKIEKGLKYFGKYKNEIIMAKYL